MEKNLQTAATSNSGHSKKTLLIALSIIAALLILAGAVLAVFIVQQTKFEKQTITLIQNGEYEEASSAVIDKKLSNRQKTALSTAFTNALKDAKIKVVSDLSEAKIQEYQQLKKLGQTLGISADEPAMKYIESALKLEQYCDAAVLWRLALGEEMENLGSISNEVTMALNESVSFSALLPKLSALRTRANAVKFSNYDKDNKWVAEASVSQIMLYGGLSNMCDGILQNSNTLFSKGQQQVTSSIKTRIKILEQAESSMTPAINDLRKLPSF